jgi:Protein of unknown function (DUF1353)
MNRNIFIPLIAAALSFGLVRTSLADDLSKFGHFVGPLDIELVDNNQGSMGKLLSSYAFVDPDGKVWTAPKGLLTDGASIPQALWSIVGSPWTGLYRNAAVIHDQYCDSHSESWQAVHRVFYLGMLANGVGPIKAKIMYAAVYRFGPRWDFVYTSKTCKDCAAVPYHVKAFTPSPSKREMEALKKKIEMTDPPIESIESESDQAVTTELTKKQVGIPVLIQ